MMNHDYRPPRLPYVDEVDQSEPDLGHINFCLQMILGLLMLIAAPFVLAFALLVILLCLILGVLGGITVLPAYMLKHNDGEVGCCMLLVALPCNMVILPFVGLVIAGYIGVPMVQNKLTRYFIYMRVLLCGR